MEAIATSDSPVRSNREFQHNLEDFFIREKPQILETIQSAIRVPYYQKLPSDDSAYTGYIDFCKLVPVTDSNDLFPPTDFFAGNSDELIIHPSGGSTGKRIKEIAISHDAIVFKFSDTIIDILKRAKHPALLHKDLLILSYLVTEASLMDQVPNIELTTYKSPTEVPEKIRDNDVVCITEQVSKFRELMHNLEKRATQSPEELAKALRGKKFLVEIGAEPINIDEVKKWYVLLQQYSGVTPEFWGLYGTTETLLIGLWVYRPGDDRIRYEVKENRFVEILKKDSDTPIFSGEEGRVIVTPLRPNYKGTNLLRYDTGDLATVEIEGDKMFISDIHRKPEDGMISIWGHKIYGSQIHDMLEDVLDFPIILEIGAITVRDPVSENEQIILKMNLYSEDLTDKKSLAYATRKLFETLEITIPGLQTFLDYGKLVIETSLKQEAPPDAIKAWRLITFTGLESEKGNIDRYYS